MINLSNNLYRFCLRLYSRRILRNIYLFEELIYYWVGMSIIEDLVFKTYIFLIYNCFFHRLHFY